jgi:hypothetical protein
MEQSRGVSVENVWTSFKMKINDLRTRFIPKTTSEITWKRKGSIPVSKSLRYAIHHKHISHRRRIAKKNNDDKEIARKTYNKARNKVKIMMRKSKREHERNIANKSKTSPKVFWSHVRS